MKLNLKKTKRNLLLIAIVVLPFSCKKDPNPVASNASDGGVYSNGVFITCEGAFGGSSGTVSFYNRGAKTVSQDINSVNGFPLGNIVQSMEIFNKKGYVVVNNANKIEVVNPGDFLNTGRISGLVSPRYFLGISSSKAYVSQWGSAGSNEGVRVIDLTNNTAGALLPAGAGPEKMLKFANYVFVVNCGGFGNDSTITVINTTNDAVAATIQVGHNPCSLVLDKNNKMWVLCSGINDFTIPANSSPGKLLRIDPLTFDIEAEFTFASAMEHPLNLTINKAKNKLFYLGNMYGGKLYSFDITASNLSSTAILNKGFYGLSVDPLTDQIYASTTNFSNGWVFRYAPDAALIDSFEVGVIPGNFCFN